MAVLAFLSYTTPNVGGLLNRRRKSFFQQFTKKLEDPLYHISDCFTAFYMAPLLVHLVQGSL